jgi:hypothetical protein
MPVRFSRNVLATLLLGSVCSACAVENSGAGLLVTLRDELTSVHALPSGDRPAPPDHDLRLLVGTPRSDVLKGLSPPDYCEPEESQLCSTSASWTYVWGPPSGPPQERNGDIVIEFGGPWLLIIDFAADKVSAARWQGQR